MSFNSLEVKINTASKRNSVMREPAQHSAAVTARAHRLGGINLNVLVNGDESTADGDNDSMNRADSRFLLDTCFLFVE